MSLKTIIGIMIIGLGILGAYLFSTPVKLPRNVADALIMATLLGSLILGNALIVFGMKKKGDSSPAASGSHEPTKESSSEVQKKREPGPASGATALK